MCGMVDSGCHNHHTPNIGAIIHSLDKCTQMTDDKSFKAIEVLFKDFSKAFDSLQPPKLLISFMDFMSDMQKLSNELRAE